MRVASVVNLFPAPTEGFIRDQMDEIERRGHEVSLFALARGSGPGDRPATYASHDWIGAVRRLAAEPGPAAITAALTNSLRRRTLKEFTQDAASLLVPHRFSTDFREFDVVHCHFGHVGAEAAERWLDTERPLVVTFYGFDAFRLPRLWDPRSYRRLFRRADAVLSLGPRMDDQLLRLGCPMSRLRRLAVPVDLNLLRRTPPPKPGRIPTWFIGARLIGKKGVDDGIRAASLLPSGARLRIAGEGPLEQGLRTLAAKLPKLSVEFLGELPRHEFREEILSADGVLVPSKRSKSGDEDGTPVVALEAMALGRPVVGTAVGDLPSLLGEDERGALVAPGDLTGMAEEMASVQSLPSIWSQRLDRAREFVEEAHSMQTYGNLIEAIYEEARSHRQSLVGGHPAKLSSRPGEELRP